MNLSHRKGDENLHYKAEKKKVTSAQYHASFKEVQLSLVCPLPTISLPMSLSILPPQISLLTEYLQP